MTDLEKPVIQIKDLEFRYGEGDFRLHIPELDVARGTTAAFIGPSGSGKTTLLHLIAGIVLPRKGRIETNGVDVTALSDEERRSFRIKNIGLVFQEFELLEYLTVFDNILLPYRINSSLKLESAVRERVEAVAKQVGIGDKLGRYPRKLSQGERQRVGVCRAVLTEPVLLFADEPTGNLDPVNREKVLDILFDYAKRSGTTLLTVTHDHEILDRFERVVDFKTFHPELAETMS
jgi:ABC-type lipoprotein export system ATPase subunit